MTRAELLEKMKSKMLEQLYEMVADYYMDPYDEDCAIRTEEDIKAVKNATTLEPIFTAMKGWDAPAAILFVFRCAISDEENMLVGDLEIPMHWDT